MHCARHKEKADGDQLPVTLSDRPTMGAMARVSAVFILCVLLPGSLVRSLPAVSMYDSGHGGRGGFRPGYVDRGGGDRRGGVGRDGGDQRGGAMVQREDWEEVMPDPSSLRRLAHPGCGLGSVVVRIWPCCGSARLRL